jgi:hypothetical protein
MPGFGRRLRAALVLSAGNDEIAALKTELARQINVSPRTFDRIIADERWANDWETEQLSRLLDVPEAFLRSGFQTPEDGGAQADDDPVLVELRALDRKLDLANVDQRLKFIEESLRRLEAATVESPAR